MAGPVRGGSCAVRRVRGDLRRYFVPRYPADFRPSYAAPESRSRLKLKFFETPAVVSRVSRCWTAPPRRLDFRLCARGSWAKAPNTLPGRPSPLYSNVWAHAGSAVRGNAVRRLAPKASSSRTRPAADDCAVDDGRTAMRRLKGPRGMQKAPCTEDARGGACRAVRGLSSWTTGDDVFAGARCGGCWRGPAASAPCSPDVDIWCRRDAARRSGRGRLDGCGREESLYGVRPPSRPSSP